MRSITKAMAIVAPNGLEMASGLLWWVGLITLAQARPRSTDTRPTVGA